MMRTLRLLPVSALLTVGLLYAASAVHAQSLGEFVDDNGRLLPDPAFVGSVDAAGWSMSFDQDGAPLFHSPTEQQAVRPMPPLHPDDIYWDNVFGSAGVVGEIRVVAISGCDDIYVGGEFASIGGLPANNVARWDGQSWHSLDDGSGVGTNGPVYAITVQEDDVYVGGEFSRAGGVGARSIAKWDGLVWSALGNGVDAFDEFDLATAGVVYTIAVDGRDVYVGGRFDTIGNAQPAANIGVWNGSSWRTLGPGFDGDGSGAPPFRGEVRAIALGFDGVYAGGRFSSSGQTSINSLARWNGSEWSAVGGGLEADGDNVVVTALDVNGPDLYVGGRFDRVGGTNARNIAVWAGMVGEWFTFGEGSRVPVRTLAVDGVKVYAAGDFGMSGGAPINNIGVWDGTAWQPLGRPANNGTDSIVFSIVVSSGDAYVAGAFETAGPASAGGVALWSVSTQTWRPLNKKAAAGGGVKGIVYAVALTPDFVYVGGIFSTVGLIKTNSLARWNRRTGVWSPLGGGIAIDPNISTTLLPSIRSIAVDGQNVYVGGRFDFAGGVRANNVAKWDGIRWQSLGDGIGPNSGGGPYDSTSTVYALAARDGALYAGGEFTVAGGGEANRLAVWNESDRSWSPVAGSIGGSSFNTRVNALVIDSQGRLFVGGVFPIVGGVRASNIAMYDGAEWQALGRGVNNTVFALAVDESDLLYVGGNFTTAGGFEIANIARWNGSSWTSVGTGFKTTVRALSFGPNGLYAAGDFLSSGSEFTNRVARWNGDSWEGLGSGLSNELDNAVAYAVATDGDDAFFGGLFTIAGGESALNLAKWSRPGSTIDRKWKGDPVRSSIAGLGTSDRGAGSLGVTLAPNPVVTETTFTVEMPFSADVRLVMFDLQGRELAVIHEGRLEKGRSRFSWNRGELAAGVYLYRLQGTGIDAAGRVNVR